MHIVLLNVKCSKRELFKRDRLRDRVDPAPQGPAINCKPLLKQFAEENRWNRDSGTTEGGRSFRMGVSPGNEAKSSIPNWKFLEYIKKSLFRNQNFKALESF